MTRVLETLTNMLTDAYEQSIEISDFTVDQATFWELTNELSEMIVYSPATPRPDMNAEWIQLNGAYGSIKIWRGKEDAT